LIKLSTCTYVGIAERRVLIKAISCDFSEEKLTFFGIK